MRSATWSLGSDGLDYATSGRQWGTAQRGTALPAEAAQQPPISVELGQDRTKYDTSYGSSFAAPREQTKASPATSACSPTGRLPRGLLA